MSKAKWPLPLSAPLEASRLARGLGGGDSAAPASIASTVALAGRAPPSATAWASAAAAATAAEVGSPLSSSERAMTAIDEFAVCLFDDWSGTLALLLPSIYLLDARQDGGDDGAMVEAEGADKDEREEQEHRSVLAARFFCFRRESDSLSRFFSYSLSRSSRSSYLSLSLTGFAPGHAFSKYSIPSPPFLSRESTRSLVCKRGGTIEIAREAARKPQEVEIEKARSDLRTRVKK